MHDTPTCELDLIGTAAFLNALRHRNNSPVGTAVVTLLASRRGRIFSMKEIAETIYAQSKDGGPLSPCKCISLAIFKLRARGVPIRTELNRGYYLEAANG